MKNKLNQKGFGLIALVLISAIFLVLFLVYLQPRYRDAINTKKQVEDQANQIKDDAQKKIRDVANDMNNKIQGQTETEENK